MFNIRLIECNIKKVKYKNYIIRVVKKRINYCVSEKEEIVYLVVGGRCRWERGKGISKEIIFKMYFED